MQQSGKRKHYKALTEMWGTKEYFAPELIDQTYGPQVISLPYSLFPYWFKNVSNRITLLVCFLTTNLFSIMTNSSRPIYGRWAASYSRCYVDTR